MQDLVNSNQIAEQILTLIANSQDSSALLDALTSSIGKAFQVDACIAISACQHFPQSLAIGWWSKTSFPVLDPQLLQKSCFELLNHKTRQQFFLQENEFPPIFAAFQGSLVANFQGKVDGALVLLQQEANVWSISQKQKLEAISEVIAIAFSHVQLQQRVKTQASYQNLLNRLSAAVAESSDLKILFNLALSEIGKALKIDRAEILMIKYRDPFFVQRKRQQTIKATLTVAESWSIQEKNLVLPKKFSFELSDSQWCQKALKQAPLPLIVNEDVTFPDLAHQFFSDTAQLPQASALLIIPLMGKTSSETQPALVLGFLALQRDRLYTWNEEEINLINWISVQLSTALIHHQTLNQVQSIVDERTSQLKWSLDVQAKLSEKMRQQIEQLKKLNELKDDFLSSMSHELKTPMTSMKMAISMLRQNIPDAMREKYLSILEQEWHREYNLIKDLLTLQQVESGELTFNPKELNLNQIVENLSVSFTEKWHSLKGLTLKTTLSDSNLHFYADFDSLHHILSELLLNAGKYSDADTVIYLAATTRHTLKGKEVEITIDNYGTGIEIDELPYIFDKFRRGKGVTDRAVAGTGLGLTLVKHLVEHLNGKIEVTSEMVTNSDFYKTTFTVILPQSKY
jgi:signal transduction histidine kinase